MKIRFKLGVKLYTGAVLSAVFFLLCALGIVPIDIGIATASALAVLFLSSVDVCAAPPALFYIIVPLTGSALSVFLGQLILDLSLSSMTPLTILSNLAVTGIVYFILLLIFGSVKTSFCASSIFLFCLYFINYVLVICRGREFAAGDFYSVKSAVDVSGEYLSNLTLTKHLVYCVIILGISLFAVAFARFEKFRRHRLVSRIFALTGALICSVLLFWGIRFGDNRVQTMGESRGTEVNGALFNVIVGLRDSRVEPDTEYSADAAAKILARYENVDESQDLKPHIIVIMNEAFSDLSVIGELETSTDPIPFISSLKENTVRGNALVSVHGGNTAVSEWEFLTGNSAAWVAFGAVPYQQYITNHAYSIVPSLERDGYTTVAMHPHIQSFWSRDKVYPLMGFDECYFKEQLNPPSDAFERFWLMDAPFFEYIKERFEKRGEGEKLFMFNVTTQNHGDYKWGGYEHTVTTGVEGWYEVDQYLTLINKTDSAVKELLEYFEKEDEPVMVVMFGDHQPALSSFYSEFLKEPQSLSDQQKKHTVPFFIWTNYDSAEEDGILTGLSSLSAIMLDKAGLSLPAYQAFLLNMRDTVPAMNVYGYFDSVSQEYKGFDKASGDAAVWLKEYEILQYNNMFDERGRLEAFR